MMADDLQNNPKNDIIHVTELINEISKDYIFEMSIYVLRQSSVLMFCLLNAFEEHNGKHSILIGHLIQFFICCLFQCIFEKLFNLNARRVSSLYFIHQHYKIKRH